MSRYIDADELKADHFVPSSTTNTANYLYVSFSQIENAPTADVVEVVRCKDCKYFNLQHHYCEGIGNWFGLDGEWGDNEFCSKGEGRE